jgi:hypothetical protein
MSIIRRIYDSTRTWSNVAEVPSADIRAAKKESVKPTVAKAPPKRRLAKLKSKRASAKKVARKKVRPTKASITTALETIVAGVIEEPVPA